MINLLHYVIVLKARVRMERCLLEVKDVVAGGTVGFSFDRMKIEALFGIIRLSLPLKG